MVFTLVASRALARSRNAVRPILIRSMGTGAAANKPENPEGPMLEGYEEFLDNLKSKTEQMEASLGDLKETYSMRNISFY